MSISVTSLVVEQASGTTLTLPPPLGTGIGDLMVVALSHSSGSTPATPPGWLLVGSADIFGGGLLTAVYHMVAVGPVSSPAWTVANGPTTGVIHRVTGVDRQFPLDVQTVNTVGSGDGTSAFLSNITTVTPGALLFEVMALNFSAALVPPAGTTDGGVNSGAGVRMRTAYEIVTVAGDTGIRLWAETPTSTPSRFTGVMVAYRPALSGAAMLVPVIVD